jgi:hypothetical protein
MALLLAPQRPQPPGPHGLAVPSTLHVGSGKDFRPEWLNLDVEPRWRPDVLFDLNLPLHGDCRLVVETARFGTVTLAEETFTEIVAQDVLEHVRDLPAAMTTLLGWLETGGVLRIGVPYELSLGAWSDPTHVRAFNERSFVYFTEWSWYLGWRTHHFRLQRLDFVPSEYGRSLVASGRTLEEVLRTPRAIDAMQVELVKQPLDARGRELARFHAERPLAPGPACIGPGAPSTIASPTETPR